NVRVYTDRLHWVLAPFLVDANRRGEEEQKRAYVHVVGLGLGVWQLADFQVCCFVDAQLSVRIWCIPVDMSSSYGLVLDYVYAGSICVLNVNPGFQYLIPLDASSPRAEPDVCGCPWRDHLQDLAPPCV